MNKRVTLNMSAGVLLIAAALMSIGACTTPPTFPDTTNHYLTFNPVYIDSLPRTGRAFQVTDGGYDAEGFAYLFVTPAERDALPRLWAYQLFAVSRTNGQITQKAYTSKFLWDPVRHAAVQPNGNLIEPRKFNFGADITSFDEVLLSIEPYPDYYLIQQIGADSVEIDIVDSDVLTGSADVALSFLSVQNLSAGQSTYDLRFGVAADFDTAYGNFFLANVTGGPSVPASVANAANYGVWFGLRQVGVAVQPALALPPLPAGWIYQGWVIPPNPNPSTEISTGRFADPYSRDLSDRYSGDLSFSLSLYMPGEDFLQNPPNASWTFPMNMVDTVGDTGWVYISVEPNYQPFAGLDQNEPFADIDEGPFFYRVLQGPLPDSAHAPEFDPNDPESNTFVLQNMHGEYPRFGHPGAPLVEIVISSQ